MESLKKDALAVKKFGERHGFDDLTTPVVEMYDSDAWQHAALAAHLTWAWGIYVGMANPSKKSGLLDALLGDVGDREDDGAEESAAPDVYFAFRDLVLRRTDGSEEKLDFQPDPVYSPDDGHAVDDPEIARVVHDYTAAIAHWVKQRFEADEKVQRNEMTHIESTKLAQQERRAIFDRYCSPSRGYVMTRIAYGSDEAPEEVVQMKRYQDGTVTAITRVIGCESDDRTAYRLRKEDDRYRIYRKYPVYKDGSRKLAFASQDL